MITTVKCSIPSQLNNMLNNMPRVVVTDFRLHHTCSLIIVWLHSLSGVIRMYYIGEQTGMKLSCIKPTSKVRGLSIEPRSSTGCID